MVSWKVLANVLKFNFFGTFPGNRLPITFPGNRLPIIISSRQDRISWEHGSHNRMRTNRRTVLSMDADANAAPLARAVTMPPEQPPDVDGTCDVPALWRLLGGIWTAEEEDAARSARHPELRLQLRSLGWIAGQLQEAAAFSNNDSAKVADFIVLRDEVVARRLAVVDQRKKQRVDEMLLCRADPQHADNCKLQKVLLMYLQHGIFLQICITCYVKNENVIPRVFVGILIHG